MGGKGGTGAVRGGGGGGGGTKNPTERLDWPTARGNSSVGRAQPCQGWGRGFESRFPLSGVLCTAPAPPPYPPPAAPAAHPREARGVETPAPRMRSEEPTSELPAP